MADAHGMAWNCNFQMKVETENRESLDAEHEGNMKELWR